MSKTTKNSGTKFPPIVFFGTEKHSLITLKALVDANFPVSMVITKPDRRKKRSNKTESPAVKTYAINHGIKVLQPKKISEISSEISALNNPIGVLVSYGKIIPQSIIDLFQPGIINIHPSLLPKYRGPSPIESAIANRDNKTGVSIIKIEKNMDSGPIYTQVPFLLDGNESKLDLYDKLFKLGTDLLIMNIEKIANSSLKPIKQDSSEATYCNLLTKEDGMLDLSKLTPGEAEAKIRAYLGFPKTRLNIDRYNLIVTKAHGVMTKKTALDLPCRNGAFLSIDELIAPSGKTMSGDDFIRGYLK